MEQQQQQQQQQQQMEVVCEKVCVFEELLDIDFDYEFDVAQFFDFLRPETLDEVRDSELWFHLAEGHPPSPLLLKLGLVTEESGSSATSSPKCGNQYSYSTNYGGEPEVSSLDQWKKGPELMKLKSKSAKQSCLSKSSRLLQPTASQLAKQDRQTGVRGIRVPGRVEKLGSPLKSPGNIAATKRQKLEYGYLRKVAQLKHQTSFSHKIPRQFGSSNVNSCHGRTKAAVPKEPSLETASRAQRQRSKTSSELSRGSKYDSCSVRERPLNRKTLEPKKSTPSLAPELQGVRISSAKSATQNGKMLDTKRSNSSSASMRKESDQVYRFKAHSLTKKCSSKGEIGVLNSKRETTVPKEFKLSNSKKHMQNPPIELFSQLSLNSRNKPSSLLEDDQLQPKGLKKNVSFSMKENKNANTVVGKSTRCCLKQSQIGGGRVTIIGC